MDKAKAEVDKLQAHSLHSGISLCITPTPTSVAEKKNL